MMSYKDVLKILETGTLDFSKLLDSAFLLSVFDSSQDGLLISDENANVLYVNPAYLSTTGFTLSEIVGRNMKNMLKEKVINECVSLLVMESKQSISLTHKYITGKGAFTTGNPIYNADGSVAAVLSNTRNIDELLNLRAQAQASKSIEMKFTKELKLLREKQLSTEGVIAESPEMMQVISLAESVAKYDSSVLIYGETGTGKEVLSKFIHKASLRNDGPFIQFNCAAIPSELFESEFFGYDAGSFTGAAQQGKIGIIELANEGTLMLDEIGELPMAMQSKLLRVLQEKEFYRVGGTHPIKIHVRIISATNRNLAEESDLGNFRKDLFFRLNVMPITIPPLRERPKDVIAFINLFLKRLNEKYKRLVVVNPSARDALLSYSYPGNVRELQNLIEYLFITTNTEEIFLEDLPPRVVSEHISKFAAENAPATGLEFMVDTFEKQTILNQLNKGLSLRSAAKVLGIHPSTLSRKIQKHHIQI
ncbi:MAG: sigma 54-interacting transcriptional regulator [Anaerovorax sp.]